MKHDKITKISPLSIKRENIVSLRRKHSSEEKGSVAHWTCAIATECPGCVEPSADPMPPFCWK